MAGLHEDVRARLSMHSVGELDRTKRGDRRVKYSAPPRETRAREPGNHLFWMDGSLSIAFRTRLEHKGSTPQSIYESVSRASPSHSVFRRSTDADV